jgi:hypothetical protein
MRKDPRFKAMIAAAEERLAPKKTCCLFILELGRTAARNPVDEDYPVLTFILSGAPEQLAALSPDTAGLFV